MALIKIFNKSSKRASTLSAASSSKKSSSKNALKRPEVQDAMIGQVSYFILRI
ncbi:hypothetical protein DM01DRAFT_1339342 [Hesseltinella vesiculosa]|uniref:Uncharacterized protein n=1 Tax=Hesseltinella vesiculosa TaxID=101127 RepID=A0A1X2G7F9_9FUNG|nr:hypothetical protein DM01DRAFT_1339337 [Hesseltinella vesiculosa]ORX47043.1 hypothetical protein DM01DRAFT_1339342 [Hesseltinella vesiculosa]